MSALLNAVASGVTGLMRVGSQTSTPALTADITMNSPDKTSDITPSADADEFINMIEATHIESPATKVDGADTTVDDGTNEQLRSVMVEKSSRHSSTYFSPALDAPNRLRASSLPANLDNLPELKTGYVFDDRMMLHSPVEYHPEAPARLLGIHRKLRDGGCLTRMKLIPARLARKSEVLMVHSEDHWEKVQMIARKYAF